MVDACEAMPSYAIIPSKLDLNVMNRLRSRTYSISSNMYVCIFFGWIELVFAWPYEKSESKPMSHDCSYICI